MTININPMLTTNAGGTFSTSLDGLMQGMTMDDPAVRNQLTGGILAPTETLPMWGGVPIGEQFPSGVPTPPLVTTIDRALGMYVYRATTAMASPAIATSMSGVAVFNQAHAMINTPQSPVPLADPGMGVSYYRFGSRARIAFQLDPASNPGAPPGAFSGAALFWVPANGWISLAAGVAMPANCRIVGFNLGNSMVVAYNAATGFATWVRNGNAILIEI
jgi:hypothetical protein